MSKYEGRGSVRRVARDLMGQVVRYSHRLFARYDDRQRKWSPVKMPGVGWVVGVRTLRNGIYAERKPYEPTYLQITSSVTALLIAKWPDRKPFYVPVDRVELTNEEPTSGRTLKEMYGRVDEAYLQDLRDFARSQPRDARGRFTRSP